MKNNKFVDEKTFLEGFVEFLQDLKAEETLEELINSLTDVQVEEEKEESNKIVTYDLTQLLFAIIGDDLDEEWINKNGSIRVKKENGEVRLIFNKPIEELVIKYNEPMKEDEIEFRQVEEVEMEDRKATITCLIGCSSSGKDRILKEMLSANPVSLKGLVSHTSRPMREGEKNGNEYYFINKDEFEEKLGAGEFVEFRTYKVEGGDTWYYGLSDTEIDINSDDIYVGIFDVNGYWSLVDEYGEENVYPIYVDCDVMTRLNRSLKRQNITSNTDPRYREVLRRLYADSEDIEQYKDDFDTMFYNGDCSEEDFKDRVNCLVNSIIEYHYSK